MGAELLSFAQVLPFSTAAKFQEIELWPHAER